MKCRISLSCRVESPTPHFRRLTPIVISHLFKTYGRLDAVKRHYFAWRRGNSLEFLGPNGAGQITTMRFSPLSPGDAGSRDQLWRAGRHAADRIHAPIGYLP